MRRLILGFAIATIAAWVLGFWIDPPSMDRRTIIHEFFYITGTLAWGCMAMAIVIASRPSWLERLTGTPLDRLYLAHRDLGIAAVVLSVIHFFGKPLGAALISALGVELATAAKPVSADAAAFSFLESIWIQLRPFAVESSIWGMTLIAVLAVVTFIPAVNYRRWLTSHKLFSAIFLLLTVHCVRLMDANDFLTPFGWINLAVTFIGAWYSAKLLICGAGREKTTEAKVSEIKVVDGVTSLTVKPARDLGVAPGQFVFLASDGHEKHPFSVASVASDGSLEFLIKGLGDYTKETVPMLAVGESVRLEGPWGGFVNQSHKGAQAWVAAGIGVAPFCARLEEMTRNVDAAGGEMKNITLHWCVNDASNEPLMERVKVLAAGAGVELRIYESRGRRFSPETIFADPSLSRVGICASGRLEKAVRAAHRNSGHPSVIDSEYFTWR